MNEEMNPKRARYNCSNEGCTASFSRWDRLENHIRTHTGELPFTCQFPKCGKRFANAQHFQRHKSSHISTFNCPHCSVVFKRKDAMKRHIDNIHYQKNPKQYKCTDCDKQFNNYNWFQSHMNKHTGEFPYVCQEPGCRKGFRVPSRLKRHMKTHEGQICKIPGCGMTFYNWSYAEHLKECHPTVHACCFCERKFSHLGNLKSHLEMHKDPLSRKVFPCEVPDCPRYYFAKKNLNSHMKNNHKAQHNASDRGCPKAAKTKEKKCVQALPETGAQSTETSSPPTRISDLDTDAKAKDDLNTLSDTQKRRNLQKKHKKLEKSVLYSSTSSIAESERGSLNNTTICNIMGELLSPKRLKKVMNLEKCVKVLRSKSTSSERVTIRNDHVESRTNHIQSEDDNIEYDDDHAESRTDHIQSEDDYIKSKVDYVEPESDHTETEDNHIESEDDHTETEDNHIESEDDHVESRTDLMKSDNDHIR